MKQADANFGKILPVEELEVLRLSGERGVWIATGKKSGWVQLGSGSVMIHGAEDKGSFIGVYGGTVSVEPPSPLTAMER